MFTLIIYSKDSLIRFQKNINYIHQKKKKKLQKAISSYVNYNWNIKNFEQLFKEKVRIRREYMLRIISNLEENSVKIRKCLNKYGIYSKVYKNRNGLDTIYYSLEIQRKEDVRKVLNKNLLSKDHAKILKGVV